MTYLPECDFIIREAPFPYSVKALVTPNNDGSFSIYVNSKLSPEQKRKAVDHEIDHIENDDFYNSKPIVEIERRH